MGMDMEKSIDTDLGAAEQAYEWFNALREDGFKDRAAFSAWLKASPRHVGEFLSVAATYRHYANVDPQRRIDVEALIAEATSNVVALDFKEPAQPPRPVAHRNPWAWWLAAGVAALAIGSGILMWNIGAGTYTTPVGEQRNIELPDGSFVYLNTRSRIKVAYSTERRDIRLLEGEALFVVAREAARPFRVVADDTVIQAIGTQFNVYRRENATTVSVLEGQVKIAHSADLLSAGDQANVAGNGRVVKKHAKDIDNAVAWRQRRLVFQSDTLADIAAEFNRYNNKPRFRIEGESAAQMRFTGVFDAEAPESFVKVLGGVGDVITARVGDEVVIREK